MDADMKKALELLSSGDYTCAACRGIQRPPRIYARM